MQQRRHTPQRNGRSAAMVVHGSDRMYDGPDRRSRDRSRTPDMDTPRDEPRSSRRGLDAADPRWGGSRRSREPDEMPPPASGGRDRHRSRQRIVGDILDAPLDLPSRTSRGSSRERPSGTRRRHQSRERPARESESDRHRSHRSQRDKGSSRTHGSRRRSRDGRDGSSRRYDRSESAARITAQARDMGSDLAADIAGLGLEGRER